MLEQLFCFCRKEIPPKVARMASKGFLGSYYCSGCGTTFSYEDIRKKKGCSTALLSGDMGTKPMEESRE